MSFTAKLVHRQVIVITGATSGIGLATAYAAARQGARVVLVARNKAALAKVARVIEAEGGQALTVVADVSERRQLEAVSKAAIRAFGGYDTWVNNAGVGIFAKVEEIDEADHRRVFDVNYFGLVNGSLIAAAYFRRHGGTIVNLGSILSEVSFPLQGSYSATKAAIRSFTDALRLELAHDRAPVAVSLIKPAAIATPFAEHARNYMDHEPKLPPPLYAPEDVAAAILHAAEHGGRDYTVGGGGHLITALGAALPKLLDWGSARLGPAASKKPLPPQRSPAGNLFAAGRDGDVRADSPGFVLRAATPSAHPIPVALAATVALGGLLAAFLGRKR